MDACSVVSGGELRVELRKTPSNPLLDNKMY